MQLMKKANLNLLLCEWGVRHIIVKLGYNARFHSLKERALSEIQRSPVIAVKQSSEITSSALEVNN